MKERKKLNEAKQSQLSALPTSFVGKRSLHAVFRARIQMTVETRSTLTVTCMLLSVFGNHWSSAPCQLYRFCVALSSFGLQESIDREENVLRSGPISILAPRKAFRRMGWARSVYLTLSSARLANCKGWIAVFPMRTLLAFGTDSSSLFGTGARVTGCSASLFSAQ